MATYLILAQSDVTARALGAWLEMVGEPSITDLPNNDCRVIVHKACSVVGKESAVLDYEYLARRIEKRAGEALGCIPLNEIVVLVDAVKPSALNPLAEGGWDNIIAMLILTFPEIRWMFGVQSNFSGVSNEQQKKQEEEWGKIAENHSLSSLLTTPRRDPLLDATGLRNFVRNMANISLMVPLCEGVPTRKESAAAIDEEIHYALFHAYAAYRFGFRADAVRSWALMEHFFGKQAPSPHGFYLLLEDVNLNFPDKPGSIHLSTFDKMREMGDKPGRAGEENCPRLTADNSIENSEYRIIVSSGHSGADADKMKGNREFIERYKEGRTGFVFKPVGGIFDLWEKARLFNRLNADPDDVCFDRNRGKAPGFYWPPIPSDETKEAGGHSAPGKLMLIAQQLVRRADALLKDANTVEECIRGALLATDALELLRYQTPTLALQALSLKHEFEVKAEVAFLGVGNNFDMKRRRYIELEGEVKVASQFFQKARRKAAELDTLVSIGNRLMLVFRNAGQFDEELTCLARIRRWQRKLRLMQSKDPLNFFAQLFMAYAEWLLESPGRFICALTAWYVVLLVGWCMPSVINGSTIDWVSSASFAWNSFIATNPEKAVSSYVLLLNTVASAAGVFHLGVFISYLYSAISRK